MTYHQAGQIRIDSELYRFVNEEALPGTGISADAFWAGFSDMVERFSPEIRTALDQRDRLQAVIDEFMTSRSSDVQDVEAQMTFLRGIGYIEESPEPFRIDPQNVDDEIATIAGPQLVVPVTNARYALNAANARWGSLYDALYGTDAISQAAPLDVGKVYNPLRGKAVIWRARLFLDETMPLLCGSHADATRYFIRHGQIQVELECGRTTGLKHPTQFVGFDGLPAEPRVLLLCHHGLHVELQFDRETSVGAQDNAGISDIMLEAALTTIIDCEDSVSAVDAEDKVLVYRNWLGLMQGTLSATLPRGNGVTTRRLEADREYMTPDGALVTVPGRSLMLVRTVGHHMVTDAVLGPDGSGISEGLMDAAILAMIALHDLRGNSEFTNSRKGSIYIVRPKMHGPAEVALSDAIMASIEDLLNLPRATIKMGIMDEERRTSTNLAACLAQARHRAVFINTGFLDRTGDEIHSCMKAGPVVRKADMKGASWIAAYEQRNVAIGLKCGMRGRAQIGKGMWAMPDRMADMLAQKGTQLRAGASTAWVPSPTAATLHAMHYHFVDVAAVQSERRHEPKASLAALLTLPLGSRNDWSEEEVAAELDNNLQGILGYVSRWVGQGVGCSKVPDLNDVALMEDRATLRISSQHVANWLMHEVVSPAQVRQAMQRMARVVDEQNSQDPDYVRLTGDSPAFLAASDLVFEGAAQPNGYTEEILHRWRRVAKRQAAIGGISVASQPRFSPLEVA